MRGDASNTILPPWPPSPPSGPPRGTNFSRRKLHAPSPPRPALIWIRTSSTNIGAPFQRDDCMGMTCEEHPVAPLLMPGVLAVTKL
jgi:hypothetical protein